MTTLRPLFTSYYYGFFGYFIRGPVARASM